MSQKMKVMYSSSTNEWSTPVEFYNKLNKIYNFTLDPCSTNNNHKCEKYFTQDDDGLVQDWGGERVFMNPPYGREIKNWIRKAHEESLKDNTVVVCLVPSRTDTRYWHDHCMKAAEIHFIKGRLKFGDSENAAPFPSAVIVFDSQIFDAASPRIHTMKIR